MGLKTVWVVFREGVKSEKWTEQKFRFSTDVADYRYGELLLVETKYGIVLAKFMEYGYCEKPEMLKKVVHRTGISE